MLETGTITSVGGRRLEVNVDTVCVHGDNPAAVAMTAHLRRELEAAGWTILPFARP